MTNLEKYLYQLRRIEEHRSKAAEKEIRKIYKELLKELNGYLGNIYATYSEEDVLTYAALAQAGMDARFLEEVEQRISGITPQVANEINSTVNKTYEACFNGMQDAVIKAAGNREVLKQSLSAISAVTPDVIKRAVENPVSGLTLKDTLEKHRKDIIYDIKKHIGVGLSNGDRFSTMAKRISESLDSDYKKSVRIVRTEAHRVRESGFNDAARDINETLKKGTSGYVMAKTWHTMQDSRVRPNRQKSKKYNHEKMDGVTIPQDELFKLPSGATCLCPSQTGVAGEDINCRCYLSYDLVLASELTKVEDGTKSIEEAVKVETPVSKQFTPANTIAEAEQYARENFAASVSYSGANNLDNVNTVNKTLYELKEKYPIRELKQVKTNARLQRANARACYDELEIQTKYINGIMDKTDFIKSRKNIMAKYTEQLEEANKSSRTDKAYTQYKKKLRKAIKELEEDLKYKRWTITTSQNSVEDELRATITHEYGHILADQYIGQINRTRANKDFSFSPDNNLYKKCQLIRETRKKAIQNGDIYKLSRYAATDEYEFFAEAFCANELGFNLPKYIKDMLKEVVSNG